MRTVTPSAGCRPPSVVDRVMGNPKLPRRLQIWSANLAASAPLTGLVLTAIGPAKQLRSDWFKIEDCSSVSFRSRTLSLSCSNSRLALTASFSRLAARSFAFAASSGDLSAAAFARACPSFAFAAASLACAMSRSSSCDFQPRVFVLYGRCPRYSQGCRRPQELPPKTGLHLRHCRSQLRCPRRCLA